MRLALTACVAALISTGAPAQDAAEAEYLAALEEALPGKLMNNPLNARWQVHGDDASSKVIKAPEIPGQRAFQVRVKQAKPNPWDVSVHGSIDAGVAAGDTVFIAFWARAANADRSAGPGAIQVRLQQKAAPYAGVVEGTASLAEHWRIHYLSGVSALSLSPGEIDISFNIGDRKQTVEFGQYYVTNVGPGVNPATLPSGSVDPS